jgi:hypothetical protein
MRALKFSLFDYGVANSHFMGIYHIMGLDENSNMRAPISSARGRKRLG